MIAYSKTGLDNLRIQNEAEQAFRNECIGEAEQAAIKAHYPTEFYTPHFFIRVGLFILTIVIAGFTLGLVFFMTIDSGNIDSPIGLLFFFALLSYGSLEFCVRQNHHYRSGVDDALLWLTVIFFASGLSFINNLSMLGYTVLLFVLSAYLSLRFADALMSALACLAGFGILFYAYLERGPSAKLAMPFAIMAAAVILYLGAQRMAKWPSAVYYRLCLLVVRVVALLSFYAAGNYFMVTEMGHRFFAGNGAQNISIGWLFWALTVSVPLLYMYRGVQKKDSVFLRTGLLLIAAMIVTIRYYYNLMPLEIAMVIGGMLMITVAYVLIRYLQQPHQGFTYKAEKGHAPVNKLQVEALVINQTFGTPHVPETAGTRFGGGSGGGGGASGDY